MKITESLRLIVRTWEELDLAEAVALWSDPEVTRYIAEEPFNERQVIEHLERLSQCQRDNGFQYWALELKDEEKVIGCCGLRPWIFDETKKSVEIGFHIARDYWGKGLATEAARQVIDYAFMELKLESLYSGHHPENQASKHLLIKLGFKKIKEIFFPQTAKLHPSYCLTKREE